MSDNIGDRRSILLADQDLWAQVPKHGFWRKLWFWLNFWIWVKTARLRFIAILILIGSAIAYWDTLLAYYEKWTRPPEVIQTAGNETEYFCPMHPQIVRDNSRDKCPICFMPLSRRKKGEGQSEALPPGVVSRVQLSPYRIVLAGVQTWQVDYHRMTKEINAVGFVEFDERRLARISNRVTGRSRIDKLYVNVTGQMVNKGDPLALLYNPVLVETVQNLLDANKSSNRDLLNLVRDRLKLWGIDSEQIDDILRAGKPITQITIRSPIHGHVLKKYQVEGEYVDEGAYLFDVADLSTVWVQAQVYEDEASLLKPGLPVSATTVAFPNQEFPGTLSFVHPHLDPVTRTLTVRFDVENASHELRPGMSAAIKLHVPVSRLDVVRTSVAEDWRNRTAVELATRAPLAVSESPGLMWGEAWLQAAGRFALLGQGEILAVPENAVIDTGSRKIVYRENTPGVFDGIDVRLGPRLVGPKGAILYPVLRGLDVGDRVVTNGSFLIDAETRLNPAAGSIYYGGSSGAKVTSAVTARPTTPTDEDTEVLAARAKLRDADRRLVETQEFCPVLKEIRLGSMGTPLKIMLRGQPVFLCCKGCEEKARADANTTLAEVEKLKAGVKMDRSTFGRGHRD